MTNRLKNAIGVTLLGTASLVDAGAVAAPAPLTAEQRAVALQAIEKAIETRYVFAESRAPIVARLEAARATGRYDVQEPGLFAERVTEDLRAASRDGHLYLRVDEPAYRAALAGRHGEAGEDEFWRRKAIREHHGLVEARILPGNVRYLRIAGFEWATDLTGTAYDAAMAFLRDGDAIVVDLRGNGGGDHAAVRYLASHFLDDEVQLMTFLSGTAPPQQSWTLDHVPAGRLKGKPLYVLIDGRVGSAAEEFAYQVQQYKLGELVGSRTAGAANNNLRLPVAPCFVVSVSAGRPEHPVSRTNWEGVGIAPTVPSRPTEALDTAHALALQRLIDTSDASNPLRATYRFALAGIAARAHPTIVPLDRLASYAGRYGDVEIAVRDDALWFRQGEREARRLLPMDDLGLFRFEDSDDLRAVFDARSLEVQRGGPASPRVFARDDPPR